MERYILDTNTWIEHFHQCNGVTAHVRAVGRRNLCVSEVTLAELTFGAYNSDDYDLTVVTDNVKHFEQMPGVKVENWIARE